MEKMNSVAKCPRSKFTNALDLYNIEATEQPFSTGVRKIDELFGGAGIPPGTFLEVVGCSSTGKTQLCMQLCAMVQKQITRKCAVFIDTEGSFSTVRLCEIAKHYSIDTVPERFLSSIMHTRCTDLVQLTSAVCRLENLLESNPQIGLVIIDSIAMPFRGETDYIQTVTTHISRVLSRIAVTFRCLVVVVNHVTAKFGLEEGNNDGILAAALGTSWSHRPSARVWLCPPNAENMPYKLDLVKSSFCARGSVFYRIQNEFFSSMTMAGVSEEFDEIFMEVGKDLLCRSINPREQTSKIRLTKIRNLPHLKIELKTFAVIHEMPVSLIPTRQWKQYRVPNIVGAKVAISLPPLHILRSLITSVKNMGLKYMTFQGNQRGELYLTGDMDSATIQIYFSNLSCSPLDDTDGSSANNDNDPSLFHEVRVPVREVFTFLRSINTNFTLSRILLKIVPDKMVGFCIQQEDASFTYGITAVAT